MISATNLTGGGDYSYDTAGLLTNRTVGVRTTGIISRDGEGRPLSITTTINGASQLTESPTWLGDGQLATHTLNRSDFTDSRIYSYAALSRRVTQEKLNLNSSTTWTNNFIYDNGIAAGPGVLTQMGENSALWTGGTDSFSRVSAETNNVISYAAYGHVNGQSTLSAWLDNQPISVTGAGANAMEWRAMMELTPGTHQLEVAAAHPSGQFTAWATNSFTNSIAYQAAADTYDNAGNITVRVWKNANGTTNRVQTLSWDARGRLHAVTERDASNSGYNWAATYDGLNRRLSTSSVLVTNGVAISASPSTINSSYDPQVEFLELGVACGTNMEWKLYGPDLNGKYGGLNGTGGFDAVSPSSSAFDPTISDMRGNILGYYDQTKGSVTWNSARPTGYGAVPDYRPLALTYGVNVAQSSAWRGRWADITSYHQIGMRPYDPISGRWLTYDSVWNERDPNYYTFAGGDPINGFDTDGRFSQQYYNNVSSSQPNLLGNNNFGTISSSETMSTMIDSANLAYDLTGESHLAAWTVGIGTMAGNAPGAISFYQSGWSTGNGSTAIIGTVGTYAQIGGGFLTVAGIMYDYNNYQYHGESGLQFGANTTVSATAFGLSYSGLTIGGTEAGGPVGIALSGGYLAGNLINNYVPGVSTVAQSMFQPYTDEYYSPVNKPVSDPNNFEINVNSTVNPFP